MGVLYDIKDFWKKGEKKMRLILFWGLILGILLCSPVLFGCTAQDEVNSLEGGSSDLDEKEWVPSCVRGKINCSYPGECGQYKDSDGNKICDLSEP